MYMIELPALEQGQGDLIAGDDRASATSSLTTRYCKLLREVGSSGEGQDLWTPSPSVLEAWDASVVAWTDKDIVVSGLYFVEPETKPTIPFIGGLVTDPRYRNRGLSDRLVGCTKKACWNTGATAIELDVRFRRGRPNPPAYRLFVKHGFQSVGIRRVRLSGQSYELHLYNSLEADGESILSLRMSAFLRR